jgi:ferritin-like protein
MKASQQEHTNRTGIMLHPDLARALLRGTRAAEPSSDGDATDAAEVRVSYAKEAEPIGSMPRAAATGRKVDVEMAVFLDKLGERMAFERAGARLYEVLLSKFDAFGTWDGGPSRDELEKIRDEERRHFLMLTDAMAELGGDPTAVTPSADLQAVASKGLCAVLADPRTTLQQCLEAMLIAELVDNDCWPNLVELGRTVGQEVIVERFGEALAQEERHLALVRTWISASLGGVETHRTTRKTTLRSSSASKPKPKTQAKARPRRKTTRARKGATSTRSRR